MLVSGLGTRVDTLGQVRRDRLPKIRIEGTRERGGLRPLDERERALHHVFLHAVGHCATRHLGQRARTRFAAIAKRIGATQGELRVDVRDSNQ